MQQIDLLPDRPYETFFIIWVGVWFAYVWALANWARYKISVSGAFLLWLALQLAFTYLEFPSATESMQRLTIIVYAATPFCAIILWLILVLVRRKRRIGRHLIEDSIEKDFDEANPDGFRRKYY